MSKMELILKDNKTSGVDKMSNPEENLAAIDAEWRTR